MTKKNTLFALLIITITSFQAQELKGYYMFDVPVNNDNLQYKTGHKVKVVGLENDSIVSFIYMKFSGKTDTVKKLNKKYYYKKVSDSIIPKNEDHNIPSNDTNDIEIHTINKSIFNETTSRYHYYHWFKDVKAGIFTVPFKLRIDDFDFEQNVNLGMSLSMRLRMNRKYDNEWLISPTIGIGLSSVKLNSKNSNLEANGDDNNRTASAFSLSGGLILELKDNINLSVQYGIDMLSNDDKEVAWKYNKKPWLGIGINIGFPITKDDQEAEPQN